ncbi:hypothetical protein EXN66_Car011720 [Channa argus]|uniref:Secreted protein n=1 Tax=Channa argus TaxID=215402 RepID=A0A6G1Q0X3_CHAAH|nr:hypothetical protein EXN66_Car011720 [Channa argus]
MLHILALQSVLLLLGVLRGHAMISSEGMLTVPLYKLEILQYRALLTKDDKSPKTSNERVICVSMCIQVWIVYEKDASPNRPAVRIAVFTLRRSILFNPRDDAFSHELKIAALPPPQ